MNSAVRRRARVMRVAWSIIDSLVWVGAFELLLWIRLDFDFTSHFFRGGLIFGAVAVIAHLVIGYTVGPYSFSHFRGSYEEAVDLGFTVAAVTLGLFVWSFLSDPLIVPRGVPLSAGPAALVTMMVLRFVVRGLRNRHVSRRSAERRAIIFGAGDAGRLLVRQMLYDEQTDIIPVAMLDDAKNKQRARFDGIHVRGNRSDLASVAKRYQANTLAIALPNADAPLLRALHELGEEAGLEVLSLPPLREMMGGRPTASDLRSLDVADLLGRRPVQLDTTLIAESIAGKTVLVTGAGGSIGSELCRQIAKFGPAKLYLLDRDESGLQSTQLSLRGHGLLDSDELLLANIRDVEAVQEIFARVRPQMVFHAAALKHLTLLEAHPLEAWKTNVIGTLNVLTAAAQSGVETFVNISTDKAANPSSVLGYSKRIAERLTADFARRHPGRFVSVRFGNVLGSRGSVVHVFTAQIERGGPVTVTHPDVERYFMLIPEACQLVLEAAVLGSDGEVMVLDMGEPVKIVDVANTMIKMSGRRDIEIVYTGLRPGEKLGEELFSAEENRRETSHSLVESVDVPAISPMELDRHLTKSNRYEWMRSAAMATHS